MYMRWMVATSVAAVILTGCDRLKQSTQSPDSASGQTGEPTPSNPPSRATTGAAAVEETIATTFPAALRSLTVTQADDSVEYEFPSAHLHIDRRHREVFLYSKDPDNVEEPYSGNSYYLPLMTENFDEFVSRFDAHQLDKFEMRFKPSSGDFDDAALDGIYLAPRYRLQASSGTVRFSGSGPVLHVAIEGRFLKFDTDENSPDATSATVGGTLMAVVDADKPGEAASED